MIKRIFLLFVFTSIYFLAVSQKKETAWDNTINKNWPVGFVQTEIQSSSNGTMQKAIFYKSRQSVAQPLIISLHTWSGDYNQEDPLAKEVLLRDWNYIHPDFRGPNNNPIACGSPLVIADLEDAIHYAIKNGNVDTTNVHIIGASGGGYATMLAYMKLNYPVKSFNAWVGISNLSDWYWESKGRNARYATDIEQVAMKDNQMNWDELYRRSPIKLPFYAKGRKNASLNIYAGVHDGYTGSVPISHSILFYNKIADALYPGKKKNLVSDDILISLLAKRTNPSSDTALTIGGRKIHLYKKLPNLSLTIFEGGHEMLVPQAFALSPIDGNKNLKSLHILTIGDSNGAFEYGWPQQMMKLMPYATVINKSIAGNTIGFDNLDQPKLNTLTNINQYLDDVFSKLGINGQLDYIFIGLGTNDTKTIFKDRQKEVRENMTALLKKISSYLKEHNKKTLHICIITPSPMDEQKIDTIKYGGGDLRIQKNNEQFKKIAAANYVDFLDSYILLKRNFAEKTTDGIHLNEKTQFELASIILTYIKQK
ncbi:SGNH/GDSL hydrolase family protein [Ferruginibacter sp.]|nr:prolyl oligopeptidase family serine peptidase [Ferruginibacter sp.]